MPPRRKPGVEPRTQADGSTSYRIRWHQGGGRDGRYLSHTFPTQKRAADALAAIVAAGNVCHCPKHVPAGLLPTKHYGPSSEKPKGPTFGEYAARYAEAMTGVGEGYRRDVTRDIRRHMQGHTAPDGRREVGIADRPLREISRLDVQEWIRGMETGAHWWLHDADCQRNATRGVHPCSQGCESQRSLTTIRRILAQLSAVMESAIADRSAEHNPFRKHRLISQHADEDSHDEQVFLTHEEWDLLAEALPEGGYRDFCTVLIGTGLRWSELAALPVGAVDLLAAPPRLQVARAWKKDGKGGRVLGPPKSSRSRRAVTLPTWVRDALISHVMGKGDDEFVFTTPRGRPLIHSNFYNKVWLPAVRAAQAAGLNKKPRIHDLRHSHVSWMIAAGRPLESISRRIGHQSYHLTIDRYGHLMPQVDADDLAALERVRTRD